MAPIELNESVSNKISMKANLFKNFFENVEKLQTAYQYPKVPVS